MKLHFLMRGLYCFTAVIFMELLGLFFCTEVQIMEDDSFYFNFDFLLQTMLCFEA